MVVVERLAGGQNEPPQPLVPPLRDEQLRAAPVVAHQRHHAQVEAVEKSATSPTIPLSERSASGCMGRR